MFKKLCKSITPLMLLAAVPALADEPVMSKFKLTLGGYVKLDYAHNSNASGPTTNTAGAAAPSTPSATAVNNRDESIFTAKQSRFWMKVAGPELMGAKTNAMIEADFYGSNALSNEFGNMRMRHAYGTLDWDTTQVLFGQTWDTFGPAAADTIDFRQGGDSGTPNNPRVPQLRLTQKLNLNSDNALKFVVALQNPVQDNASGSVTYGSGSNAYPLVTGAAGVTGKPYGSVPNVAGQIMFTSKALGVSPGFMGLGMNPLQVGIFGMYGNEKVIGYKSVDTYGYGVYGFVPVLKSQDGKGRAMTLSLETQAAMVGDLNVLNGTSIAFVGKAADPIINPAKGFDLYAQLKFYPTQELGVTAGYTRRGIINYDDYKTATAVGGISAAASGTFQVYNEITYLNLTYDLNAAVRLATEYEHHVTQYAAKPVGAASDMGQNNVFRLAAYYFF